MMYLYQPTKLSKYQPSAASLLHRCPHLRQHILLPCTNQPHPMLDVRLALGPNNSFSKSTRMPSSDPVTLEFESFSFALCICIFRRVQMLEKQRANAATCTRRTSFRRCVRASGIMRRTQPWTSDRLRQSRLACLHPPPLAYLHPVSMANVIITPSGGRKCGDPPQLGALGCLLAMEFPAFELAFCRVFRCFPSLLFSPKASSALHRSRASSHQPRNRALICDAALEPPAQMAQLMQGIRKPRPRSQHSWSSLW